MEPWCEGCKLYAATCIGRYEVSAGPFTFGCDHCCGHGNEDGRCARLDNGPELSCLLNAYVIRAELGEARDYGGKPFGDQPARKAKP